MDYKKFLYESIKKSKDSKKKQSSGELKTLKIRLSIGEGDLNIKINQIKKFLENGDKVKLIVMYRGREILYSKHGFDLADRVINSISELGKTERKPKLEGRNLITILSPFSKSEIKKG
jgi:translation initiation factor IF-3